MSVLNILADRIKVIGHMSLKKSHINYSFDCDIVEHVLVGSI